MEIVVKEQVPLVSQQQNLRKYLEKRKFLEHSSVPKLIGNKRRHLERQLSAAKRDALIIQETKNNANFHIDLTEAILQSNEDFASSIQQMSSSVLHIPQGMVRSIEILIHVDFGDINFK